MAAESVGMSQKKKDRAAPIGMIIFFSGRMFLMIRQGELQLQSQVLLMRILISMW